MSPTKEKYHVGDCFTAEIYGELAEYVVVSVYEKIGVTDYGVYGMQLNEGASRDIRQIDMLESPALCAAIKKEVVNLHWLTFDELADMIVAMSDTAKVVGYASQVYDGAKTNHLFLENKGRIIQVSVPKRSELGSDFMLKYVFSKNISKEEFDSISEDKRLKFVPLDKRILPVHLDKRGLFDYLGIPAPYGDVEVHGLIINDFFAIADYDHFYTARHEQKGLITTFRFLQHEMIFSHLSD